MALENKFRVSELVQSGSRAIISEDPISKTHTFIDGSTTIVSKSATEPYEHIEGDRDGELVEFIEKPKYQEEQLKKAVDTVIDELILPPLPPSPEVVPKPVYDDLLEKYNNAVNALAEARDLIRSLQAQIASLEGLIQSLRQQLDAAQVAEAIAQNQLQQQASAFAELSKKFGTAITKAAREAAARVSLQAQVEGLTAQKETLREQILQLRQIIASLQGQVQSQIEILNAQVASAEAAQEAANQTREDLLAQQERERLEAEERLRQQQEAADTAAEAAAEQADQQAEESAAIQTLTGYNGTYGQQGKVGWKLIQSQRTRTSEPFIYVRVERTGLTKYRYPYKNLQGQYVNLYNFNSDKSVTFSFSIQNTGGKTQWLTAPSSITIPPRNGDQPGKGYIQLGFSNMSSSKNSRNKIWGNDLTIRASTGEQFTVKGGYDAETRDTDKASLPSTTKAVVGQEKL